MDGVPAQLALFGIHLWGHRHPAADAPRIQSVCLRGQIVEGSDAEDQGLSQRFESGYRPWGPGNASKQQRPFREDPKEFGGLLANQTIGIPSLLLLIQRRALGNPRSNEEPARCAASLEE